MANVERYSWNVQINGVVYLVEYMKGSVYINGGEAFKLRSLEYKRKFIPSRMSYTVPLAGKELTLVIGQIDGVVLLMDGIDMSTGQQYQVPKLPGWVVVFYVLYIINIFAVLGGAGGALINATMATITTTIVNNKKLSSGKKVAICIAIYVVTTVLEFVIAISVAKALHRY